MTAGESEKPVIQPRLNDFGQIPGIQPSEVDLLGGSVSSRAAFEQLLDGKDPAAAVDDAVSSTGIEKSRMLELLAASLRQRGESLGGNWLSAHWFDLALASLLLILIALPVGGHLAELRVQHASEAARAAVTVVTAREVSPYIPLDREDIRILNGENTADEARLVDGLIGRYSRELLPASAPLSVSRLSASPVDLAGNVVIRIELTRQPAIELRSFPVRANLLLSAREGPAIGVETPIVLLDVIADGSAAVLAVPEDRIASISDLLGRSEAYLYFAGARQSI